MGEEKIEIMKTECKEILEQLAKVMKMTKVNDEFYYGEHGTLFKATNFGFVLSTLEDYANPSHPNYSPKYNSAKRDFFFKPISDTQLGIYKTKK